MSDNESRLMGEGKEVSRRELFRMVDDLRDRIGNLEQQLSLTETYLGDLKRAIKNFSPARERGRLEKRGRFSLGEKVEWSVRGTHHRGKIILIIDPLNYPDLQYRQAGVKKEYNLRTRGYFRYEESYLIEDETGQQFWPRVGWLRRVD